MSLELITFSTYICIVLEKKILTNKNKKLCQTLNGQLTQRTVKLLLK